MPHALHNIHLFGVLINYPKRKKWSGRKPRNSHRNCQEWPKARTELKTWSPKWIYTLSATYELDSPFLTTWKHTINRKKNLEPKNCHRPSPRQKWFSAICISSDATSDHLVQSVILEQKVQNLVHRKQDAWTHCQIFSSNDAQCEMVWIGASANCGDGVHFGPDQLPSLVHCQEVAQWRILGSPVQKRSFCSSVLVRVAII